MKSVTSAPAVLLQRIETAKQSIEGDKQRAREQGREYVPVFGPVGYTEEAVAIFVRLSSHPEMQRVWKTLSGVFDDAKRSPDTLAFANFCYQTIGVWRFSPKRTPAEHKHHFDKIAHDIRDVVRRIVTEPEFGMIGQVAARVNSLDSIGDGDIAWLMEQIGANPVDGRFIKNEKDAVSYVRFCLSDLFPDLYEYGEWIAEKAERIASQPSISERPNRESAERTFFVRHLSRWFRENFGKPMHEAVAGVACALFDEAVTADNVRKIVGNQPEVSTPSRRGKSPSDK
jgi:hypothetical protein